MKVGNLAVNICSMSESDVVEIKKIEAECNLSSWSIKDYYNEIERADSISLIAKIDKKIVGFIVARLIISNITNCCEIEIYNICVVSEYRRNSIGKSLIEHLTKIPNRNIKSIWLEVRESNDNALVFYSKLNFKTVYTRKNFYRNPIEDALVLKMEL